MPLISDSISPCRSSTAWVRTRSGLRWQRRQSLCSLLGHCLLQIIDNLKISYHVDAQATSAVGTRLSSSASLYLLFWAFTMEFYAQCGTWPYLIEFVWGRGLPLDHLQSLPRWLGCTNETYLDSCVHRIWCIRIFAVPTTLHPAVATLPARPQD